MKKGWLLTYQDTSGVAKKTAPWWVLSTMEVR